MTDSKAADSSPSSGASEATVREQPPQFAIDAAIEASTWSPCRSKRGAVVFAGFVPGGIISKSANFKPRGFECTQDAACKATCRAQAIHAEQAALLQAGERAVSADVLHVKTVNGALVPSGGPSCVECSKLIRGCEVAGVWLFHEDGWRRYDAAEFHRLSLASQPPVAPPPQPSWRDIESAPKDGTKVMLFWRSEVGADLVDWWATGGYHKFGDGSEGWCGESFHTSQPGTWTRLIGERPTHWMPLPAPPNAMLAASPSPQETEK